MKSRGRERENIQTSSPSWVKARRKRERKRVRETEREGERERVSLPSLTSDLQAAVKQLQAVHHLLGLRQRRRDSRNVVVTHFPPPSLVVEQEVAGELEKRER